MIFSSEVSFPYPILSELNDSYKSNTFRMEVELNENTETYFFRISFQLPSSFLSNLIYKKKAKVYVVIRSIDNKLYEINKDTEVVEIPKSRISLNKRTSLQLFIRADEEICFADNYDIDQFYDLFKDKIIVPQNYLLALSNVVVFDGSIKKPFELFEKKISPDLKSDIQIELGSETIVIHYKNEDIQFATSSNSKVLNYPYLYIGLQKALIRMVDDLSLGEGIIYIDDIEMPENGLQMKLINLMNAKKIEILSHDNIDEVIYKISDKLIEKYVQLVKGIQENGN